MVIHRNFLLPRRKSPSSGEIASFPETLWDEGTLIIMDATD